MATVPRAGNHFDRHRVTHHHRNPIDSSMKKITRYIRQLTVKTPNCPAQTHARHQDRDSPTHSNTTLPLPSCSIRRGPSIQSRSEGSLTWDAGWIGEESTNRGRRQEAQDHHVISIDVLPDDILLSIFDFYVEKLSLWLLSSPNRRRVESWQALVHVCRRWRSVVFGSPRRLNLRLFCTSETPGDMLDVWPTLPLLIWADVFQNADNIVATLERSDRVVAIHLYIHEGSALEKAVAAMQVPFPELTNLWISRQNVEMGAVPPGSFLGGSAPRLESLDLFRIPLPDFPKPLLSTTHLTHLRLTGIPHSAYISPEAMVAVLSTLTSLEFLYLGFESPQSRPDRESRRPPPPTRHIVPVLTRLDFKGDNGYIDDLVSCIDAPRLSHLDITFFNQIIFDTPQFMQFISRTPGLKVVKKANVTFCVGPSNDTAVVRLSPTSSYGWLRVSVRSKELDWQVSSMEQVCTLSLPPFSTLEDLYIMDRRPQSDKQDNIENVLWLELLHPFTTVKNLYLSGGFTLHIVHALQELVGGRATEVLPTLQNIFLEGLQPSGPVREGIERFIAARQGSIAVGNWEQISIF